MSKTDQHGQPLNKGFNWSRNQRKLLHTLHGILEGIASDGVLDELELIFLDLWIKESTLQVKSDVLDLTDILSDALSSGSISEATRQDAMDLVSCVREFGKPNFEDEEQRIDALIGILLGITADDQISNEEVAALEGWLEKNRNISDSWQFKACTNALSKVLEDGFVSEDERSYLLEIFKNVSGNEFSDTGLAISASTAAVQDEVAISEIKGCEIVITGKLVGFKSRAELVAKLEAQGAKVKGKVTRSTNILVVGGIASRDWKHTSSGNKIKDAMKLKNDGREIAIVSEEALL